jgi:hypothetical protein
MVIHSPVLAAVPGLASTVELLTHVVQVRVRMVERVLTAVLPTHVPVPLRGLEVTVQQLLIHAKLDHANMVVRALLSARPSLVAV